MFPCDACGKMIWRGWFALTVAGAPPSKVKCGACCNPPREEWCPRVRVTLTVSLFFNKEGEVTGQSEDEHGPFVMVRFDDDPRSIRFGTDAVEQVLSQKEKK
jgi:hypothetical protein